LCGISSNWGFSVLSFTMIACHLEWRVCTPCRWTIFVVARTTQAINDQNPMGILSATINLTSDADERGFHIYKSCSMCLTSGGVAPNCFPGKFSQFRFVKNNLPSQPFSKSDTSFVNFLVSARLI
jgi:hypothetical protein